MVGRRSTTGRTEIVTIPRVGASDPINRAAVRHALILDATTRLVGAAMRAADAHGAGFSHCDLCREAFMLRSILGAHDGCQTEPTGT